MGSDPEGRYGSCQYSVLVRNRRAADPIVDPTQPFSKITEAYRIRLPHNRCVCSPPRQLMKSAGGALAWQVTGAPWNSAGMARQGPTPRAVRG